MTTDTVPTWGEYGFAALEVVLFVLLLAALWELINALTRFDDEKELFDRRNVPYALVRSAIVRGAGGGDAAAAGGDRRGVGRRLVAARLGCRHPGRDARRQLRRRRC